MREFTQVIRECCITAAYLAQELQYKVGRTNQETKCIYSDLADWDFSSSSSALPDKPDPARCQGTPSVICILWPNVTFTDRLSPTVVSSAYASYSRILTVQGKQKLSLTFSQQISSSDSCQLSVKPCQASHAQPGAIFSSSLSNFSMSGLFISWRVKQRLFKMHWLLGWVTVTRIPGAGHGRHIGHLQIISVSRLTVCWVPWSNHTGKYWKEMHLMGQCLFLGCPAADLGSHLLTGAKAFSYSITPYIDILVP